MLSHLWKPPMYNSSQESYERKNKVASNYDLLSELGDN